MWVHAMIANPDSRRGTKFTKKDSVLCENISSLYVCFRVFQGNYSMEKLIRNHQLDSSRGNTPLVLDTVAKFLLCQVEFVV